MDIHGYVLVYSIVDPRSFEVIQIIYDKLTDMTGKNIPLTIVGNKKDLHSERKVSVEQGKKLAESWKASFLEASAKNNDSVTDIFSSILSQIEKADSNTPSGGGKDGNCSIS